MPYLTLRNGLQAAEAAFQAPGGAIRLRALVTRLCHSAEFVASPKDQSVRVALLPAYSVAAPFQNHSRHRWLRAAHRLQLVLPAYGPDAIDPTPRQLQSLIVRHVFELVAYLIILSVSIEIDVLDILF